MTRFCDRLRPYQEELALTGVARIVTRLWRRSGVAAAAKTRRAICSRRTLLPRFNGRVRLPTAETAYLFRHALLRDAAYQLQLPGDRARLHRLAFELIEIAFGGRAPEPPALDDARRATRLPQPTDPVARELAEHAKWAEAGSHGEEMRDLRARYLRYAAEYLARIFQAGPSIAAWRELSSLLDGAPRGEALRMEAEVRLNSGDLRGAEACLQESLILLRQGGNPRRQGVVLANLGTVYMQTGRKDASESAFGEALAILRGTGDEFSEARALGHLAVLYLETGRVELAEQTHGKSIALFRRLGESRLEGVSLANLATLLAETGRAEAGKRMHEEALALHRRTGDRRQEGITLMNMGVQCMAEGGLDRAAKFLEEAIGIAREVGDRRLEGYSLLNSACVCESAERFDAAERTGIEALALFRDMGDRRAEGAVLSAQAVRHHLAGRKDDARPAYRLAGSIFEELGDRRNLAVNGCNMALLELPDGDVKRAAADWARALAMLREVGDVDEAGRQAESMRKACRRAGVPPFDEGPA